jgi:Ca-activated chloride channel family protein
MKYLVAPVLFSVSLFPTIALAQNKSQPRAGSRSGTHVTRNNSSQDAPLRVCKGVPLPGGYTIIAYETSSLCPDGAYVLKKNEDSNQALNSAKRIPPITASADNAPALESSRPRRITTGQTDSPVTQLKGPIVPDSPRQPELIGTSAFSPSNTATINHPATSLDAKSEEVGEGDVVRIDTNLVVVPVSVLDRQGKFVSDLSRENFTVLDNSVEQPIAFFEPTEKPFTVALLLDTSGSTFFHLSEIKEAAIAFAKQLRPQDRVLVVTFDDQVLLLTEATNDLKVVTEVIQQYANTGYATRLYDALNLVINQRLNKIQGRKAIVLFTDGVDTASYGASYESTLRQAEELDALIYPVQYDTMDFINATQGSLTTVTTTRRSRGWPFPSKSSSHVTYGLPSINQLLLNMAIDEYKHADEYLHQLASKTGARLYQANDRKQLADAFWKIAEELRCQYSLGYYPQASAAAGEHRQIKVRVNRSDLVVRAKDGYVQRASANPKQ